MRFCPRCARPLEARDEAGRARKACPDRDCGFVFYDNPLPVVAALVEHEGRVLLVRNQGWPEKWFGLVAGFLERGESPAAGVLRELKEEVGLVGEVVRLLGVYAFPERNEVILAYHVRATGTVSLGEEIAELRAVQPERLRPWPFGTGQAVADWLAARETS
ncbi:MAG: NUDIX domain-containing protein [Myxococcaceae bacterium]